MSTTKPRNGVGVHPDRRNMPVDDHQRHTDLPMRRGTLATQRKTLERGLSRDTGSMLRSSCLAEESLPTALPMLLTMVEGPGRLPVDEDTQEVLRGKLRLLQPDSPEVIALFTELSSHIHSISSEENTILLTFKTFEEIWKFTTYYSLGFLDQCMESLLFEQKFWIQSLDRDDLGIEVSVPEDSLHLMVKGLLMQEGSFFASCSSNQIFDSSTCGGDLYLEQGDVAQFEPPILGSGWGVLSLNDGARGTTQKPALEPLIPFYQWFLKSCPENVLVGGGKPVCNFPLRFARGTCRALAEYHGQGPDELSLTAGERVAVVGRLVSGFEWFLGRAEATGAMGLVQTALVEPAGNLCESTDIYLDAEERSFFCFKEESIIQETTALLKTNSQSDIGYVYKLDLIPQQDGVKLAKQRSSLEHVDADARLELKANMERILAPSPHRRTQSETESAAAPVLRAPPPSPPPEAPCFAVHAPVEGTPDGELFAPLLSFLEGAPYRREFAVLYGATADLLSSSLFAGHADEDALVAFLSVARETARKRRLHWAQSRACLLLGLQCAGRSKFSQARVYLEEALAVPKEAFADVRLLAALYANLAHIHLLQKNGEKYVAAAERLAAAAMALPECVASAKDHVAALRYALRKAVLTRNKMAEARACFVLAKCHRLRGEDEAALPYVERLLELSAAAAAAAEEGGSGGVPPSRVCLGLGRIYGALGRPLLSVCAARRAASEPAAALGDCLGALALVLERRDEVSWLGGGEGALPCHAVTYLRRALALVEGPRGDGGEEGEGEGERHALSHALTLCLSGLLQRHGMDGHAVRVVRSFVDRRRRTPGLAAGEGRSTLVWLAWLCIRDGQEDAALDVLDAIMESPPSEHGATPQDGLVLNMRGIALRRQGHLQRAAESYRAADDICEEFDDMSNWAVCQANFGLLCLKAGAKTLAERHLTRALELFSGLEQEGPGSQLVHVLLELGRHYLEQGRLHYGQGCLEWALLLAIKAGLADCHLTATQQLCRLYGEVRPDQARCIVYNEHQLPLLAARGDRSREGDVLQAISEQYLSLGTAKAYRVALDCTKRSLGIFIDLGQREQEAYAWLQAGKIYHMLGQKELVDLYIQVAQDVGLITGDTGFVLALLEAAGDVFHNSSQDRDKAVCFYRDRALPIALKTGSEASRLRLCHKLVDLLLSLRRHDDAVEFAQTALDISITLEERLSERVAYHRLATIYQHLGQWELAEHHYLKALALCPAPLQFDEETLYYARVYQTLGDIIFYDLKDPHDAAGYYHLALAAAMDLGNKRAQLRLCTRLATIYHNYLVDRQLSLCFYQRARAFATELNVRRVDISASRRHISRR
ncbi:SH3 domain and tetratricopeptide repeat-containing protein 1 [Gadus macrocephalus]|uniref:SH3 domain and tetratricopeptide repeat-containing protein 1 n=1 Tax=Gadus macrocephalus TaxID=80720 RepID=UPI0028CB9131|nr:SH3 domain and tetratricopeptide repeat-containing protein 1 [Gadus macrocephalus]